MDRSLIAGLGLLSAVMFAGCGSPKESTAPGTTPTVIRAHAEYRWVFRDLGTMVATSDLIVEGTVIRVGPVVDGGSAPDAAHETGYNHVTVRVDRWLFGPRGADDIVFRQTARQGDTPVIVDGVHTAQVGDRGFYVLLIDRQGPPIVYSLMGGQGQYVVGSDGRLFGSDPSDVLVQTLNELSADELRNRIVDVVPRVERGEVRPAPGK